MLSRTQDHRESLIRNLATSVVLYERVVTTEAKAKIVRPVVERLIAIGKEGGLRNYRRLLGLVFDRKAAKKIVEDLAPRYKDITGGYAILTPLPPRRGDAARMMLIELRSIRAGEAPAKVAEEQNEQVKAEQKTAKPARKPVQRKVAKSVKATARKPSVKKPTAKRARKK